MGLPSSTISPGLPSPGTCATVGHALLSKLQLAPYLNLNFSLPVAVREETTARKINIKKKHERINFNIKWYIPQL